MLYEKCYEDNVFGKITDDAFCHLSAKYSAEKTDLVKRIAEIQETLGTLYVNEKSQESFINAVRNFMKIDKLTPTIMNELIERIEVYDAQGSGKSKTQRVVIFYRFTGNFYFERIDNYELIVDPQKGCTVSYSVDTSSETDIAS